MNTTLLVFLLVGLGQGIPQVEKTAGDKTTYNVVVSTSTERLKAVVPEAILRNVQIRTESKRASGVIVQKGIVLVSFHVLEVNSELYVDGKLAKILAVSTLDDLVLVKVETARVTPIRLAQAEAEQMDEVFSINNANNHSNFLSRGIITAVENKYLFSDIVSVPGASGGGLYNMAGELVGLNDGVELNRIASHVKLSDIRKFLEDNKQFLK